jgi:hypothetical protein
MSINVTNGKNIDRRMWKAILYMIEIWVVVIRLLFNNNPMVVLKIDHQV